MGQLSLLLLLLTTLLATHYQNTDAAPDNAEEAGVHWGPSPAAVAAPAASKEPQPLVLLIAAAAE